MSEAEMRELDAWIAEHLFELKVAERRGGEVMMHYQTKGGKWMPMDWVAYTKSPADALAVLKRCTEKGRLTIYREGRYWLIENRTHLLSRAPTLEEAICIAAKALFDQHGK